ncbi:MFS transporter [Corynebacterium liangguodongii]|uniref:Uncharacterized protein n=1 Tax=Corynebacterium liangguodongii TaxID=2079535 RepID=A0A2S0WG19_9CORY|nr:MFS transporter [Corynebacterium liangguodongii]AWB84632.1 hypothetical protein C3E79_09225 [Corynebacterium liangguodongii]PWB99640.1 MFS transporter [Corynebacterium liangguodongii]
MRWGLLAVLSAGLLLIGLDNSILYTAMPTIAQQLGTSPQQDLWIINAYPLAVAALMLGTGPLGDRYGHALLFSIGLIAFGVASVCCAAAPTPELLIAARGLLGVAAAVMMPPTLALIQQTFVNARERNTAVGIWASASTVGAAAGPVVAGLLLERFWWGSIFLVNVPIVAAALAALAFIRPRNLHRPGSLIDAPSVALSALTLICFTLALKGQPLFAVPAVAGGWLFGRRQARLERPLLRLDLFANRTLTGGVVAAGFAYLGVASVEYLATQRFQTVAGLSPLEAGALVALVVVAALPSSILAGALLHRTGYLPPIVGGSLLAAAGVALAALNVDHTPTFLAAMLCLGAGTGGAFSAASTAIISAAPPHHEGMAAGVEEVTYELGALVGVAFIGTCAATLGAHLTERGLEPAEATDAAFAASLGAVAAILAATAAASAWLFARR